jgi:glyoxylase-like metal-dependent hydrolase (beta-lactamase superfamily II)
MGYGSSAEILRRDLESVDIRDVSLDYLLPTHVHLDHSGSCGTLARWFTSASVRVHPRGELHLTDPTRLVKSARELFGDDLMKKFGLPEPIEHKRATSIADSDVISLGESMTLRAIWTPGHAPHHLSYLLEEAGILFTGDAVGVQHPGFPVLVPTTPPPSFDLEQTIESIEHLRQFTISRLCTPHFGIQEGGIELFDRNVEVLMEWKAVLEALMAKGLGEDAIIQEVENDVAKKAGKALGNLPDYLRLTLRLTVQGFMRYLKMRGE